MPKLYTKKSTIHTIIPYLPATGFGLLLLILAIVFVPHAASWRDQAVYNNFMEEVKQEDFTMRQFWEFREFYAPGSFEFNKDAVQVTGALEVTQATAASTPLMTFKSKRIVSTESLVNVSNLDEWLKENKRDVDSEIFRAKDRMIYFDHRAVQHLIFLRPIEEMRQTNGFFDYDASPKDTFKNKYWLVEATLL